MFKLVFGLNFTILLFCFGMLVCPLLCFSLVFLCITVSVNDMDLDYWLVVKN